MLEPDRPKMTLCTCWTNKATDRHLEYVILIALQRQQWFLKRALRLRSHVHFLSFSLYLLVRNAEFNEVNEFIVLKDWRLSTKERKKRKERESPPKRVGGRKNIS